MNIVLALAEDRGLCEALRAALPKTDLLLFEHSPDDALRRLISVKADVILVDDAPTLGLQAVERLLSEAPTTPIVMLSARGDGESLATYTMAGARHCVVKPFQCEDIAHAVSECLGQNAPSNASRPPTVPEGTLHTVINQHQMALRWMSRNTAHLEDLSHLTQSLADALVDVFDAVRASVLLKTNGNVRIVASHGIASTVAGQIRLTFNTGLMRWLEAHACLLDRGVNVDATDALKEMHVLGGRLAVPLMSGGRTCGAVVLGEKASGTDYGHEERELLTTMARCASSCLEQSKHYRDVSKQQGRLDAILANITAGVVTIKPDRTISMMNESAERILRLRAMDVLGRSVQKLGSSFADVVLRTMEENRPRLRQTIHDVSIDQDLGLSVTPLGSEGVVVIFSLLPTERSGEENLDYSPVWEYLASRVAQEIKNPMVAINTFAQLLPRKYDSPEFRDDFAEVVQKEVARINGVVETLFDFARHPRPTFQVGNLNDAVAQILSSMDDTFRSKSIRVETRFGSDDLGVRVDPPLFAQAIANLMRNSIEAMPEGGTLRVTTKRDNTACRLTISDSGPGVSEQNASLIFRPFFSTKEKGMGLGLTLANRIVAQHEGHIELLSDDEGGSAFAVLLPHASAPVETALVQS